MPKFKLKPQRPFVPRESEDQENLFSWAAGAQRRFPELAMLFAVPNGIPVGGPQRFAVINAFKKRGLKNGVPDVFLLVQRTVGGVHYAGLAVELKRVKKSVNSPAQDWWINALRKQGYKAEYCHGFKQAAELIVSYLLGERVS